MEDFFDQNEAKAFVYLLSEGDDKNKLFISDEKLLIIRKNQRKTIVLKNVARLKIENKKQLLPLILGGIITPFAFLSFFINLFMPWIHLISVMVGLLLFYLGWVGKSALILKFKNGDELVYYLPSISKNLIAFIDFANAILQQTQSTIFADLIYFEIAENDTDAFFGKDKVKEERIFPIFGYTQNQLKNLKKSKKNIVGINPLKTGRELRFSYDLKTNQMRPILSGTVLPESKVDIGESS